MTASIGRDDARQPYIFDKNPEADTQRRLLAQILDDDTLAALGEVGVRPGQRWLDVGAGAGTISQVLADAVGPSGHVTALDLDCRLIEARDNLTLWTADIRDVALPDSAYDGVHVRLLTMHLPDPVGTLTELARALVPGGVLVVAEWDCEWRDLVRVSPSAEATALVNRFLDVSLSIGQRLGVDLGWAKRVHAAMVEVGLRDVVTRTDSRAWDGGTGICLLHQSNARGYRDLLLQAGFGGDELARFQELMVHPDLVLSGYLLHTTTGRRV